MSADAVHAVVLTLDEEQHLAGCLQSLRLLTDHVLVLDSGSSDRTQEVAREEGACVSVRPFEGYASQRNAALDLAAPAEWVVFLDADERLSVAGAGEIATSIARAPAGVAALWLPRRNIVFGRALRGGGWWPDYQPRVLRRGRARYDEARQVHEVVVIDGASRYLSEPLLHLNYASRREFAAKQRAYTERRVRAAALPAPRRRAYLGAPARELARRFVRLGGYRDGVTGLFLASVLAVEEARACYLLRRRAGEA
jgi:glycosyltransferase involved in cell wall biosynthesis